MNRRLSLALWTLLALGAAACTEQLDTTGSCPAFCPGEAVAFRDTVIYAVPEADTTYVGYPTYRSANSLLVANGGAYGEARAFLKFFPRGDSLMTDSNRAIIRIDSIFIELVPESWDPAVADQKLEIYRLPLDADTALTLAQLDQLMTPESFLRAIDIAGEPGPSPRFILFEGEDLEKLKFEPGEPTNLVIGLRLSSATPTGIRLGAAPSGGATPSWTTWATVAVGEDSTDNAAAQRPVMDNISKVENVPIDPLTLRVGGLPASRSFLRFNLPPYLRDSAILIRATLQLGLSGPVPGIPGDSSTVDVENLLADLGAKSPVTGQDPVSALFRTGQTGGTAFEILSLVRTWQGARPLPSILRLSGGQEGASFTVPSFFSTRQGVGAPSLRITWRPQFGYPGF